MSKAFDKVSFDFNFNCLLFFQNLQSNLLQNLESKNSFTRV